MREREILCAIDSKRRRVLCSPRNTSRWNTFLHKSPLSPYNTRSDPHLSLANHSTRINSRTSTTKRWILRWTWRTCVRVLVFEYDSCDDLKFSTYMPNTRYVLKFHFLYFNSKLSSENLSDGYVNWKIRFSDRYTKGSLNGVIGADGTSIFQMRLSWSRVSWIFESSWKKRFSVFQFFNFSQIFDQLRFGVSEKIECVCDWEIEVLTGFSFCINIYFKRFDCCSCYFIIVCL